MDFMRRQEAARRHTRLLLVLFVLAVLATAITLDLLCAGIWLWIARARSERAGLPPPTGVPESLHLRAGALRAFARGLVRLAFRASHDGDGAGGLQKLAFIVAVLPWILGAAVSVIGAAGALSARLVRAAVSRQREFLGDAAAVQFTRNPDGIGRALQRVAAAPRAPALAYAPSEALSHFFFVAPGGTGFLNWLGSHPRPRVRLRRIYARPV